MKPNFISRTIRAIKNELRIARPNIPIPDPDGVPNSYTYSGTVSQRTIPAAYAAINVLTNTMTRLTKTVGTRDSDGFVMLDYDHPVSVLMRQPSRLIDGWQFWELLYRDLFTRGNGYAWIRRASNGFPIELVPATVDYARRIATGEIVYSLETWGQTFGYFSRPNIPLRMVVPARDVIALHGPGFDGLRSPSPIEYEARAAIQTMQLATENNRVALASGMNARTVITSSEQLITLPKEKRDELMHNLEERYTGAHKAGKIPVLPPGFKPETTGGFSALDMQLIELLKWNLEDVARIWGVPPRMIQHYDSGMRTATSLEQQAEDFDRWSIQPHVARCSEQLTAKLLAPLMDMGAATENTKVMMDTETIREGSFSDKVKAIELAVARGGLMTPNEGRRRLGLPPIEGGDNLLMPKGSPADPAMTGGDNNPPPDDDE